MSYQSNLFDVPHQFIVAQGSDLGYFGAAITIVLSLMVGFRFADGYRAQMVGTVIPFSAATLSWVI